MPRLDEDGNPIILDDEGNPVKKAKTVQVTAPAAPGQNVKPTVRTAGPVSRFFGGLNRTTVAPAAGAVGGVAGYYADHPIEATVGAGLSLGTIPMTRLMKNVFEGSQAASQEEWKKALELGTSRPAEGGLSGVGHGIAASVPLVGPAVAPEVDRMFQGDVAGGIGGIAGMVAQMILGNKIMSRMRGGTPEVPPPMAEVPPVVTPPVRPAPIVAPPVAAPPAPVQAAVPVAGGVTRRGFLKVAGAATAGAASPNSVVQAVTQATAPEVASLISPATITALIKADRLLSLTNPSGKFAGRAGVSISPRELMEAAAERQAANKQLQAVLSSIPPDQLDAANKVLGIPPSMADSVKPELASAMSELKKAGVQRWGFPKAVDRSHINYVTEMNDQILRGIDEVAKTANKLRRVGGDDLINAIKQAASQAGPAEYLPKSFTSSLPKNLRARANDLFYHYKTAHPDLVSAAESPIARANLADRLKQGFEDMLETPASVSPSQPPAPPRPALQPAEGVASAPHPASQPVEAPPAPALPEAPPTATSHPVEPLVSDLGNRLKELRPNASHVKGFSSLSEEAFGKAVGKPGQGVAHLDFDQILRESENRADIGKLSGAQREAAINHDAATRVVDATIHEAAHGPGLGHGPDFHARMKDLREAMGRGGYEAEVKKVRAAIEQHRGASSIARPSSPALPEAAPVQAAPPVETPPVAVKPGPPPRAVRPELPPEQKAIHDTANLNIAKRKLAEELAKPNPDPAAVEEFNSQVKFYSEPVGGGGTTPPAAGAGGGAGVPPRVPPASGGSAPRVPPTPPGGPTPPSSKSPDLPPVRMTLGERTGSGAIKKVEGAVEGTFGGIGPFKKFREAQQGDIQNLGKAVAKGISEFEGTDEAVGIRFQKDAETALAGLKSSLNTEYGELDAMVGSRGASGKFQKAMQPSTLLPKSFAKDALKQIKAESGLVASSISKELVEILEKVADAPERMTFKAMQGARSTLAGVVRKKGIGALSDKGGGIVKKLVQTIDTAMEEAAAKNPEILKKWRSLNARSKELHDVFDRSAVASMMEAAPEKVPGMIKGMSLEDIDRLHTVTPKETVGALQRRVVESIFDDATVGEAERHFLPEGVRELMGRKSSPDVKMKPDKLRKTLEDRYGIPKLERIFKDNPQGLKNVFKVLETAERVGHTKGSIIGAIANFRVLQKTGKAIMTMDPTELLEPAAIMASAKILSKLSTSTWGSSTLVEFLKASPGTAKYQFWSARMKEAVDKAEREGKAKSSPSAGPTRPPSGLRVPPSSPSQPQPGRRP